MQSRIWTSAFVLAVLLALQSTSSNAQQSNIGKATGVKPQAARNTQTLGVGSEVYANDTIRTGNAGAANLKFNDDSNLSVASGSEVRLNKFVYDPNKGTGSGAIEATRGAFRFVTGSQSKGSYTIKTPYGTLGVRG